MSSSHDSPTPLGHRPDPYDRTAIPAALDDLFDVLIYRNSRVCTSCFTRLARLEHFPDQAGFEYGDLLMFVESNLPEGAKFDILDIEYLEQVRFRTRQERAYPPGATASRSSAVACSSCGAVHPQKSPPPRSREQAMTDALTLSDTLTEYGVVHDWITLLKRVKQFKRTPRLASRDRDIFAAATALSIAEAADLPTSGLLEIVDDDPDTDLDPQDRYARYDQGL